MRSFRLLAPYRVQLIFYFTPSSVGCISQQIEFRYNATFDTGVFLTVQLEGAGVTPLPASLRLFPHRPRRLMSAPLAQEA